MTGFEVGQGGPVIRSITPIISNGKHLGSVEAAMDISEALQNLSLPQDYGVTVLLNKAFKRPWESPANIPVFDRWILIKSFGSSDSELAKSVLELNVT